MNRLVFVMFFVLPLTVLSLLIDVGISNGNELSSRIYPLPIRVEKEVFSSSLYLSFPYKEYEKSLNEFNAMPLTNEELALKELIEGVKTKNYELSAKRIQREGELSDKKDFYEYVDIFHDSLKIINNLYVFGQIPLDNKVKFIMEGTSDRGPSLRTFTFIKEPGGDYVYAVGHTPTYVDSFISMIYLYAYKRPQAFYPIKDNIESSLAKMYKYQIPLKGMDGDPKKQVNVYFRGHPISINIMDESQSVRNPIITFYQNAYLAFKANEEERGATKKVESFEPFYQKFSSISRDKIKQAFSKMTKEEILQYRNDITKERYVRFLIDADPVYVVFYAEERRADIYDEYYRYEYIIKDSQGKYSITNLYRVGILDDLFANRQFQDNALKPIIADNLLSRSKNN